MRIRGVYVIDPSCLDLIPRGRPYDFAKNLFPLMLERDMPIYCYHTADYWCDVGSNRIIYEMSAGYIRRQYAYADKPVG